MAWNRSNKPTPLKRGVAWFGIGGLVVWAGILPLVYNPQPAGKELATVINIRPSKGALVLAQSLFVELEDGSTVRVLNQEGRIPAVGEQICLERTIRSGLFGSIRYMHADIQRCQS